MVTISDIARLSGVAKSTVSRYLNGGSVGGDTRIKIEKIIRENGYIPNSFAQSLKTKRPNIIGTVVPRLDSYASSRTLMGIDEQLLALDYEMMILNSDRNPEREVANLYSLARQKVAGIILLATEISEEHITAFQKLQVPILLVGQQYPGIYSLIHDDEQSAYDLCQLMLKKRHRHIAFLGVTEKDKAVGIGRKKGFIKATSEYKDVKATCYETGFGIEEAQIKAEEIIRQDKPTAWMCATDNIALGVLKAAHNLGLSVPDDFSITGFGDYEIAGIMHPGLTTVNFFYQETGRTAASSMFKLVNGQLVEKVMHSQYKIIERESLDIPLGV
ncbi:LacI family DNA-binding transcriptional regulator [Paenibacillus sp. FSL R7-0331]|uniref:LacI family DNA-binding transcriptional regulator n=1 Tax=Paenibacillus sp. FSL R7-0331 TaxID=1536773 RepID=UPI0004F83B1E|nr:LacI family DNA-binding transcriptional regulator [Paenibacillus sp. FSL R7-0331]AIQ51375.1 LacI family transcriptional regulator [Paenibacillus sp. FSL R7-0331]